MVSSYIPILFSLFKHSAGSENSSSIHAAQMPESPPERARSFLASTVVVSEHEFCFRVRSEHVDDLASTVTA